MGHSVTLQYLYTMYSNKIRVLRISTTITSNIYLCVRNTQNPNTQTFKNYNLYFIDEETITQYDDNPVIINLWAQNNVGAKKEENQNAIAKNFSLKWAFNTAQTSFIPFLLSADILPPAMEYLISYFIKRKLPHFFSIKPINYLLSCFKKNYASSYQK